MKELLFSRGNKIRDLSLIAFSIFGFLFFWEILALLFNQPTTFPSLIRLVENMYIIFVTFESHDPISNYMLSLIRIIAGFILVMLIGIIWGIAIGSIQTLEDRYLILIILILPVPSIIWAFLAILWFGITEFLVPIFTIVMIVFPYVTLSIWEGMKDIDQELLEMAEVFKSDPIQRWRYIYFPSLTPYIFASMRTAFTISWQISLVAEIFGVSTGVGPVVNFYYLQSRNDMVIAWALPIMLFVLIIERFFQYTDNRVHHWRTDEMEIDISIE